MAAVFAAIVNFFSTMKALVDFVRFLQDWRARQQDAAAKAKQAEREAAVDSLKQENKTDEEIFNEQTRVVDNKP